MSQTAEKRVSWEEWTDQETGRFLPGNPGGGRPHGSISARKQLQRRMRANPAAIDEIIDGLVAKAKSGDSATIKLFLDAHDGLQVIRVEGLSETELRERIASAAAILKSKLPPEHHAAIGEAMVEAMRGGDDDDA